MCDLLWSPDALLKLHYSDLLWTLRFTVFLPIGDQIRRGRAAKPRPSVFCVEAVKRCRGGDSLSQ